MSRELTRELWAEFLGTLVLITFGVAVVAQVVLGGGQTGEYLSINFGWGLGVTMGVYVAGGITGSRELMAPVRQTRSAYGFQLDPHSCWMLSRSMETLALRMERAADSADKVAGWLAQNPFIPANVLHVDHDMPETEKAVHARQCSGAGSTFSFVVEDDRALAFRILNNLTIFKLAVSLGGSESLACHPASTTHSGVPAEARAQTGVTEGLIRPSVGLEHPDDLIRDLEQAFRRAMSGTGPTAAKVG